MVTLEATCEQTESQSDETFVVYTHYYYYYYGIFTMLSWCCQKKLLREAQTFNFTFVQTLATLLLRLC